MAKSAKNTVKKSAIASSSRAEEISNIIRGACSDLVESVEDDTANRLALEEGRAGTVNKRELVLGDLAALAALHDWTPGEIDAAAPLVTKSANNSLPKSIATFIGEAKVAMRPKVRDVFAAIVTTRNAAWDQEAEAQERDPAFATPIKKAFVRRYHFLLRLLRQANADVFYPTVEDCVTYAQECDPDFDTAKIAKRVAAIRADIDAFYADFPSEHCRVASEALALITKEHLNAVREELTTTITPAAKKPKAAHIFVSTPNAAVVPTVPTVPDDVEIDLLGDALIDMSLAA